MRAFDHRGLIYSSTDFLTMVFLTPTLPHHPKPSLNPKPKPNPNPHPNPNPRQAYNSGMLLSPSFITDLVMVYLTPGQDHFHEFAILLMGQHKY